MVQGNLAALQSVTRDAARIALVGEDLGTVEEGKLADLIVVGGNPLQDVRAAADVRLALEEQARLCREQPVHCEEGGGGHAH